MSKLDKLVEEQNKLWNRMQELTGAAEAEDRDMSAEERTNWDAAEAKLTEVSRDIDRYQRMQELEKVDRSQIVAVGGDEPEEPAARDADHAKRYAEAFSRYVRRGMTALTVDQQNLLERNFVAGGESRAQATSPDTAGGFLVPDEFRNVMADTLVAFGGLMNVATVIETSTGADLSWPSNNDTGNVGAILGENTQVTEQDMVFGERKLGAYTYTSKLVRVSMQLLQDSAFNLETWLPQRLGERIGRAAAAHFATGTGTNQPQGITVGVATGATGAAGQVTSITYDDLVDLEHSVNSAYRSNSQYLMSDSMLKVLRKLKDENGRPLWQPIPAPGFPATINGFAYTIDDGMPAPAAGAKSLVFGDLKRGYIIRRVRDVQVMRLAERYADFLQVGFLGFSRLDGKVDDAAAVRAYAHASE